MEADHDPLDVDADTMRRQGYAMVDFLVDHLTAPDPPALGESPDSSTPVGSNNRRHEHTTGPQTGERRPKVCAIRSPTGPATGMILA